MPSNSDPCEKTLIGSCLCVSMALILGAAGIFAMGSSHTKRLEADYAKTIKARDTLYSTVSGKDDIISQEEQRAFLNEVQYNESWMLYSGLPLTLEVPTLDHERDPNSIDIFLGKSNYTNPDNIGESIARDSNGGRFIGTIHRDDALKYIKSQNHDIQPEKNSQYKID
jgi:hypothetical protein